MGCREVEFEMLGSNFWPGVGVSRDFGPYQLPNSFDFKAK